ncbi:MAG: sigma-70 family RNA polymerase sigma factor [Phycisphaerales bacterium]|nr:sigma-70 family RNA polymerase sigma factor [Phycisphaerales bacterium]
MSHSTKHNQKQVTSSSLAPKSNRRCSTSEQALIEQILSEPEFFVPSPLLRRKHAQALIFDDVDEVPRNSTSWYCPAIDCEVTNSKKRQMLLSREQEQILFRQYNYARMRVSKLQKKLNRKSKRTRKDLDSLLHWHSVAQEKREHIVECNLALVLAMAKRSWAFGEYADLVAEGNIALCKSVDRFDPELGYKFSTYACRALSTAFNRFGKNQLKHQHAVRLDDDAQPELVHAENEVYESSDVLEQVRQAIRDAERELTSREQDVLRWRFGLHAGHNPPLLTLAKAGKQMGVSKECIRQIQLKALEKIQESLEIQLHSDLLAS